MYENPYAIGLIAAFTPENSIMGAVKKHNGGA
jgi:hypothetical protein